MDVRQMRNEALGKRVVQALESRNMEAYYVETKEEAVKKAHSLPISGLLLSPVLLELLYVFPFFSPDSFIFTVFLFFSSL